MRLFICMHRRSRPLPCESSISRMGRIQPVYLLGFILLLFLDCMQFQILESLVTLCPPTFVCVLMFCCRYGPAWLLCWWPVSVWCVPSFSVLRNTEAAQKFLQPQERHRLPGGEHRGQDTGELLTHAHMYITIFKCHRLMYFHEHISLALWMFHSQLTTYYFYNKMMLLIIYCRLILKGK